MGRHLRLTCLGCINYHTVLVGRNDRELCSSKICQRHRVPSVYSIFLVANMFVIRLCTDGYSHYFSLYLVVVFNSRLRLRGRNANKLVTKKNNNKMHSTNKLEQLFKLNAFSLYSSSILTTGYLLLFWA